MNLDPKQEEEVALLRYHGPVREWVDDTPTEQRCIYCGRKIEPPVPLTSSGDPVHSWCFPGPAAPPAPVADDTPTEPPLCSCCKTADAAVDGVCRYCRDHHGAELGLAVDGGLEREQLRETLAAALFAAKSGEDDGWVGSDPDDYWKPYWRERADLLLPAVDAYAVSRCRDMGHQ